LAGEMGNVKFALADRFHVRQRRPDKVLDAGILGGVHGSGCLLQFLRSALLKIGYQEYAMRPSKCWLQGFGALQVRFNDFVGKLPMLGRIASQGAYLEMI